MNRIDELIQEFCPDGVNYQTLGDVAQYVRGVTYSKNDEVSDGGIGILRSNNINVKTNTIDLSNLKRIRSDAKIKETQRLTSGDILMSAASGSKEHVGKVAFSFEDTDLYFGGFMAVIRCSPKIEGRFLFHLLTSRDFSKHLENVISSTTINNLSASIINPFRIPVPPIEVQREIVSILDKFTQLEAELEAELEARKKQFSILKTDKFNQLIKTAPLMPLGVTVEHLRTGLNPRSNFVLNEPGSNCYYITVRELMGRSITPTSKTDQVTHDAITRINQRSRLKIGDVLFSGTGTIGKTALIETDPSSWNIKEGVYALTPNSTYLVSDYLLYLLQSDYVMDQIKNLSAGSTVNSIPMESLKKVKLPVPDINTQKAVSSLFLKFENLAEGIEFGLPAEISARRKQYEYYRDKLLTFKELDAA